MLFIILLVNMIKAAEATGELEETLDDMADYFTETEKIGYIPKEGNDIYIPKKMTESLAFVCGVLTCPSTEIRLNAEDKLVVVCKDRIISKIFIRFIRDLFQTIFFLPYVTNTLAVGLVFMILFQKSEYSVGLVNSFLGLFGVSPIDFIDGPYWAKMLTLCVYTVWVVLPFKILVLTTALASVNEAYYSAAKVDGASKLRVFTRITLPSIS